MGWIEDRWHALTGVGSGTWLAIAMWVAVAVGLAALLYTHRQLKRNRALRLEQMRPHVAMFMEPHASDWHLVELVVKNYGETAAHNVRFSFENPPTVAQYENEHNGLVDIAELALPSEMPVLAPGQEWRTVWDSAMSRAQLGGSIEWRFVGKVTYSDRPAPDGQRRKLRDRQRREFTTDVVLNWDDLQPVQRVELMTGHDLARREKHKLELLRSLLTYFHYASQETRSEVYKSEIDGVRRATEAVRERLQKRELEDTDVRMRPLNPEGNPNMNTNMNTNANVQPEANGGRHRDLV